MQNRGMTLNACWLARRPFLSGGAKNMAKRGHHYLSVLLLLSGKINTFSMSSGSLKNPSKRVIPAPSRPLSKITLTTSRNVIRRNVIFTKIFSAWNRLKNKNIQPRRKKNFLVKDCNISNTKIELKIRRVGEYFEVLWSIWVFDAISHWKQKRRNKIAKTYAYYDQISKHRMIKISVV